MLNSSGITFFRNGQLWLTAFFCAINLTIIQSINNISISKKGVFMMYGSKKIIWQKPNGDIVERIINGFQFYRVGDGNAYKWKIIDIKYYYKKRWYSEKDYIKLIHKDAQIEKIILSFKNNLTKAYKQVLYCLSMMIFFKIYEVSSNVIM